MKPIPVFVGMQAEQMLAFKVLEYSIKKHSSIAVTVIPLYHAVAQSGISIPQPRDPKNRPRTPFSFQRFAIPACCQYKGRAIYVDSDMQVFSDIAELCSWPFDNHDLLSVQEPEGSKRRPQFSVMVLDCESLAWKLDEIVEKLDKGALNYEDLMYNMAIAKNIGVVLPSRWNDLERYAEGKTSLTHYTDMVRQPWLSIQNPLEVVWCKTLLEAVEKGAITEDFIEQEVRRGWVRPSLLKQVQYKIEDPKLLPKSVIYKDYYEFVPPHRFADWLKHPTRYGETPDKAASLLRRIHATASNSLNFVKHFF